jgi:leader peptidase (prepilin peptidase)/N-methyltransferase
MLVLSVVGDSVSLLGIAVGSLAMWGVMKAVELLSRGDVGPADAVFAGYLGMFVGSSSVSLVPLALMTAFVAAGLVALVLMVVLRFGRRTHLPFAPFLFLGAVSAVLR